MTPTCFGDRGPAGDKGPPGAPLSTPLPLRPWQRLTLAVLLVGATLLAWAGLVEPRRTVVVHQTVQVPAWPAGLRLRVALASDLHLGSPAMGVERLAELSQQIESLRPDLVLYAGDFAINGLVGGRPIPPEQWAPELGHVQAPLGSWAVMGNHDWWNDTEAIRRALQSAGLEVLENEGRDLEHQGHRLHLIGIGDEMTGHHDLKAALRGLDPGQPALAFTHGPDLFPDLPDTVQVLLAGHTHGGQLRLPFCDPWVLPSRFGARYARGLVEEGDQRLFVTSGLGTSVLPLRFMVPPEVVLLELEGGG